MSFTTKSQENNLVVQVNNQKSNEYRIMSSEKFNNKTNIIDIAKNGELLTLILKLAKNNIKEFDIKKLNNGKEEAKIIIYSELMKDFKDFYFLNLETTTKILSPNDAELKGKSNDTIKKNTIIINEIIVKINVTNDVFNVHSIFNINFDGLNDIKKDMLEDFLVGLVKNLNMYVCM
jgi:hypothetical protein